MLSQISAMRVMRGGFELSYRAMRVYASIQISQIFFDIRACLYARLMVGQPHKVPLTIGLL